MLQQELANQIAAEEPDDNKLQAAYDALQAHITQMWATQALRNRPLNVGKGKPQFHPTGRKARRAARRGYGLHDPNRSRCTRSAARRGVRKVRYE